MDKIPLISISATKEGSVVAEQGTLQVLEQTSAQLAGTFDSTSGVLTLNIPNYGTIEVAGFMTLADIGAGSSGRDGASGAQGLPGINARDGRVGADGCVGPAGEVGETGKTGARGKDGEVGPIGLEGPQGEAGKDGAPKIYFQADDPGAVGAGAIWIRPRAAT